jgi:dihydrofolate synthase/folylpolyglutamate synthase
MFQRVGPQAFKKDLGNIIRACQALGNPHQQFNCIHIAGTNGKGSVAHFLAAVFTAAGYKTGLYTSPHYKDFRERIKIDGQLIPKKYIVDFVSQHKTIFEEIKPSFFEWTAALAFDFFANEKVDMVIIETGLGGRLDSTNIVTPMMSVITNIGFDHVDILGDTLPLIAAEKAGIIKPNTPVIIGESHPETAPVFIEKAKKENAPIYFADQLLNADLIKKEKDYSIYRIMENDKTLFKELQLQHQGRYQQKNIITSIYSLLIFKNKHPEWFPNFNESIRYGLSNLKKLSSFIGRWDIISTDPLIIVDSAHNEDGIQQAINALNELKFDHLHFVIGVVSDKSHNKTFSLLPKNSTYYFAKANIPRGLDATELRQKAAQFNLFGKSYSSVKKALAAAKKSANKKDLIFVGGSIFTVAEVL